MILCFNDAAAIRPFTGHSDLDAIAELKARGRGGYRERGGGERWRAITQSTWTGCDIIGLSLQRNQANASLEEEQYFYAVTLP